MKKLLFLALIVWVKSAVAQKDTVGLNVPFVNGSVVYERVFDAPNTAKNLLYSNAGLWFAETHPYVEDTQLQLADPTLGRVVGRVKSASDFSRKVLWSTFVYRVAENFTLQVDCKDNKYRIRIYNIEDTINDVHVPVDDLMLALINSKPYALGSLVFKTEDLKPRMQALNTVISNVLAAITKGMLVDNSF